MESQPLTADPRFPLYDPRDERDACGTGFVADISGHRSHRIVEHAVEAVINLTHRGAVSADGKTGDGAGLLTQLPRRLFMRELRRVGGLVGAGGGPGGRRGG